ncbi:MAG TPA: CDP-alcohol phosphatidyltransferase family protein [Kineosporiaceae bacterium]|nr:CDP-alcohol phosphatidyltransferase family protein [Kineosporiaceae bacterium]
MTAASPHPHAVAGSRPPTGFREALHDLARAQKPPAKGSPAYSRFVNRRLGRVLAALAARLGLTPNQVTGVSAALSAAGIAVIALGRPTPPTGIAVAALLLLGYAFDSADGQLARLRGGGSPAGEWLDHVVDSAKVSALHLAVLIGWGRQAGLPRPLLLVPIGFTLVAAVVFFAQILTDQLRRAHPGQAPAPAGGGARAVLRSLLVLPTDYGVLCLAFLLFGRQTGFALVYGLLFAGTGAFTLAALPKWFREAGRFGSPAGPACAGPAGPGQAR